MTRLIIFFGSTLVCFILLFLERLVGIQWNYHPDAETYIYESPLVVMSLIDGGFFSIFNNFYYFISFATGPNKDLLIIINIISYSLTNLIIYRHYSNFFLSRGFKFWIGFMILILIPYRVHLAIHILKDTLIILFLLVIVTHSKIRYLGFIPLLLIRLFSLFYFIILLNKKYIKIAIFFVVIVSIFYQDIFITMLKEKNEESMTFRDFDTVPTFNELGILGSFIRATIWPFFVFTGLYIVLSPSAAFFPVALGSVVIQLWCKFYLKRYSFIFSVYFSFAIIALFVNGFTSYLRYTFPLILISPILLMSNKK